MNAVTPVQKKEDNSNGIKNAARAVINDRTGLFVAIFAFGFSLLSTGLWIATMIFAPQIIQARIEAAAAPARAQSELAMKTAYTAKDQVDTTIAKAKARGDIK